MPPITEVLPPDNPDDQYVWGFDSDQNKWVPVDRAMMEGSTLGNLGRAAVRGAGDVSQGVGELLGARPNEYREAQGAAAAAAAPIAEAVGGFAPEAAAAGATGLATGGLGFLPALGLESLAAGATTALRPGGFEERLLAGIESAGLNMIGGAAIKAAISGGLKVGRGILGATQRRVADGIEAGGIRVDTARRAAEAEAAAAEGAPAGAADDAAAAGVEAPEIAPTAPGGRSVGAAETPLDEAGAGEVGQEIRTLRKAEETGAEVTSESADQIRDRAIELDMKVPFYSGTRAGSGARLLAAGRETMPFGNVAGEALQAHNQQKVAQYLGEALGEPRIAKSGSVFAHDLDTARGALENAFNYVEKNMPNVGDADFAKAMSSISQEHGPFGKLQGQKIVSDAIAMAEERNGVINGKGFMQSRSWLSGKMADLYNAGDTASGDALWQALQKMDDLARKVMEKQGKPKLANYWKEARQKWQVLQMADRPGAVNLATGDLNWRTIFNQMRKSKSKGGFGGRPDAGPIRNLYDALEVHGFAQTEVPFTGARYAAFQQAAPIIRQGATIGGAAAGGGQAASALGLWD